MSDTESEGENIHIFYKDRAEWKDVIPIPQDDGPDPVVRINYSKKCKSLSVKLPFFNGLV